MPALETQTVILDAVRHYADLADLPMPTVKFDLDSQAYSDIDNENCVLNFNMKVYDEQEFIEDIIPAAVANMATEFEKARAVFRSNIYKPEADDYDYDFTIPTKVVTPRAARKPKVLKIANRDGTSPVTNAEQAVEIYLQNTGATRQEMITFLVDGLRIDTGDTKKNRIKAAGLYQTAKKKVEA